MLKWIEIDRGIISKNIQIIKRLSNSAKLMVVVKADGYGHGAIMVSKIAEKNKVDFLGVINSCEGKVLRENGIKTPIMILAPSPEDEIPIIVKNNLIPTIDNIDFAKKLNRYVKSKISVNIDIDSGLKRWGVDFEEFENFIYMIKKLKKLDIISLSTHIAYTPYKNMIDAKEKLERFKEKSKWLKSKFPNLIIHAANSLVLLDFPDYKFDMVRIGNLVYGIYPSDIYSKRDNYPKKLGIDRPWKFKAKILSIKKIKKGQSFGYASEIVATKNMKVASVQVGYSDGLGLFPLNNTYTITEGQTMWGMIKGKKAYFVSKPAISHTLLDVTNIDVKVGDVVELPIRRTAANKTIPRVYI